MVQTNRLAEHRALKGLSQEQLAKELGLSASTIAMYEIYQRTPSLRNAKAIADYFGTSIEAIFAGPTLTLCKQTQEI